MNNNPPNPTVTEEMIEAGLQALTFSKNDREQVAAIYLAMKSAAPQEMCDYCATATPGTFNSDMCECNTDLTDVERAIEKVEAAILERCLKPEKVFAPELARIAVETIAAMLQQPIHADEIDRLIEAARDAEAQVHWGNAGTRKRANAELEAARAALLVSNRSGVERDKHALRWIFEHGLKHSTERPDFVNEALSDAMEPARAALNPIPEKDGQ